MRARATPTLRGCDKTYVCSARRRFECANIYMYMHISERAYYVYAYMRRVRPLAYALRALSVFLMSSRRAL